MLVGTAAQGQEAPRSNISFGHISAMMGSGTSLQRGEQPQHSTLGVAVGADFLHRGVIGTGQLRGKFLNQEPIRDPDFICAERDCGPAHRLGLQADAYVDLLTVGPFGAGLAGGLLAFGGTMSTMVVDHPWFEKSLWSAHIGPSFTWRTGDGFLALAPVMDVRRETTLADDSFNSVGHGITAAAGWTEGLVGAYLNGRYMMHPESSSTASRFGELYPEAGIEPGQVRSEGGVMADAQARLRIRVSAVSFLNLGAYYELTRSDLRFLSTDEVVLREFLDRGFSVSFEFLQY